MTTTFPISTTSPAPSPELYAAANPGSYDEHLNDAACIDDMADLFDLLDSPGGGALFDDTALEAEPKPASTSSSELELLHTSFAANAAAAASSAPTFYEAKAAATTTASGSGRGLSTSPVPTPSLCVPTMNPRKRRSVVAALSPLKLCALSPTTTALGAGAGAALKLQRVSSFGAALVATKREAHEAAAAAAAAAATSAPPTAPRGKAAEAAAEAAALRYAYYDGPRSAKRAAILAKWKAVRAARVCAANMDAPRCPAKAAAALRKQRDNGRFGAKRAPPAPKLLLLHVS